MRRTAIRRGFVRAKRADARRQREHEESKRRRHNPHPELGPVWAWIGDMPMYTAPPQPYELAPPVCIYDIGPQQPKSTENSAVDAQH